MHAITCEPWSYRQRLLLRLLLQRRRQQPWDPVIRTTSDDGPDGERGDGTGGAGDADPEWAARTGHRLPVGTLKSCDADQRCLLHCRALQTAAAVAAHCRTRA